MDNPQSGEGVRNGSWIRMADGTEKMVDDLRVGDAVATGEGVKRLEAIAQGVDSEEINGEVEFYRCYDLWVEGWTEGKYPVLYVREPSRHS